MRRGTPVVSEVSKAEGEVEGRRDGGGNKGGSGCSPHRYLRVESRGVPVEDVLDGGGALRLELLVVAAVEAVAGVAEAPRRKALAVPDQGEGGEEVRGSRGEQRGAGAGGGRRGERKRERKRRRRRKRKSRRRRRGEDEAKEEEEEEAEEEE